MLGNRGACLTDFRFQILGKNDPYSENFRKCLPDSSTGHRITFRGQIWWKSAVVKLPKGPLDYHTKKLGLRGTRPSPHFVQNGSIAPKVPWTLSPLDLSTCTEFGPYRLRFAGLIPERLIFRSKKSIQYRLSAYKKCKSHPAALVTWPKSL